MKTGPALKQHPITACRSAYELLGPDTEIVVVGGPGGGCTLRASSPTVKEQRREVIQAVRAGEHRELIIRARVFRQRDGSPNLNHYRIKPSKLPAVAESFVGQPVLLDHNKWDHSARIGTILESAAEEQGHGWIAILQTLRLVKPEAVISVLDGTLDRFSIGWRTKGPVLCTAHRTDKLSPGRCSCWPGDKVEIDGVKHTVEFEWQDAEGVETSGVNVPAVSGTRIEEIRAALAAELGLSFQNKEQDMSFARLAAALGVAALASEADEDRAVRAIEQLRAEKEAAEEARDAALARATKAEGELAAVEAERTKQAQLARKARVDALIEQALSDGRLLAKRDEHGKPIASRLEEVCRKMGMEQGEDVLSEYLAGLPRLAPIGDRVVRNNDPQPPKSNSPIPSGVLSSTARQLGLDPTELDKAATELAERG